MNETAADRPRHRVAIIQSAYIPWRGFFDLIGRCDEYVIFDSVQFAKRHWHNRNLIRTPTGTTWMTIPVVTKSRFLQNIDDVRISETWADRHWRTISLNYSRAPHFKRLAPQIEALYAKVAHEERLTLVNESFLRAICDLFLIKARVVRDRHYDPQGSQTDRLLDICVKAGATAYLSGPSARTYLEEDKFRAAGIQVEWMDYAGYREYRQCWDGYEPAVSILDLLFNVGEQEPRFWRREQPAPSGGS
jgi:hypothetical protein